MCEVNIAAAGLLTETEAWLRVGEERGIFVGVGGTAGGSEGALFAVFSTTLGPDHYFFFLRRVTIFQYSKAS